MTAFRDALQPVLPDDAALAGRVWCPHVAGPSVVAVRDGELFDISRAFPTMRDLCETADPGRCLARHRGRADRQRRCRVGQHAGRAAQGRPVPGYSPRSTSRRSRPPA